MNCLTVIQASQGLAKYLRAVNEGCDSPLVVIGHDSRHNSAKFARLAASAFLAQNIRVVMFSCSSPTPFVPFSILKKGASAGVMVTASHNPARDNGYKVYLGNGAQINSPADSQIAHEIKQNLAPWPSAWDDPEPHEWFQFEQFKDVVDHYIETIKTYLETSLKVREISPTPFVYTPLHGVGGETFLCLCEKLGIENVAIVKEQKEPDPDFPTVHFPNPEEAGALDLAMRTADSTGRTLVVANDPDADRFAAAEKIGRKWHKFSGDQVGVLLASFLLDSLGTASREGKRGAILATAVSSAMIHRLTESHGYEFHETLTGFKWLANETQKLEKRAYHVPFAYEEALGYMFPSICYDKDGLAAAMVFMAAETKWKQDGLTPYTKLQQLYSRYGYHQSLNTYVVSPDKEITSTLFQSIRARGNSALSFPVGRFRDMTKGFDSGTLDGLPTLPVDAHSQMITVWAMNGVRLTIRASGTEPKVKLYIESSASTSEEASRNVSQAFLTVLAEWVKPFAPSMTYAPKQTTSSGHSFTIAASEAT
ncbi:dihydrolipoamide dehydrogenase precursor [Ascosphaera pollenicola]|nr:dihydrolipoamide dehydrogenase precursor [Ascosphaera pollenicola]